MKIKDASLWFLTDFLRLLAVKLIGISFPIHVDLMYKCYQHLRTHCGRMLIIRYACICFMPFSIDPDSSLHWAIEEQTSPGDSKCLEYPHTPMNDG